jgi:hypothetical protein
MSGDVLGLYFNKSNAKKNAQLFKFFTLHDTICGTRMRNTVIPGPFLIYTNGFNNNNKNQMQIRRNVNLHIH